MLLEINGRPYEVEAEEDTPLLWVLRDHLGLTGSKFGCGVGLCGACTVHLNGVAVRSCVTPAAATAGGRITTIEGLAAGGGHPLVQAWIAEQVPQCGYCQPGMIMAAAALLDMSPQPSDEDIDIGITNLCRCGSHPRIRRAIQRAARERASSDERHSDG